MQVAKATIPSWRAGAPVFCAVVSRNIRHVDEHGGARVASQQFGMLHAGQLVL